jgi:hypothetical protein
VAFRTALFQQFVVPTVAVDPESDDGGDDRFAADMAAIANAADMKALEALWVKLGKEYTDAQDREGYKAVAQAVKAKKATLEGGA